MLDARDPGELVEHATLTESAFDRGALGIDTLFVVGDELFGYLFRPENGWGSGGTDRSGDRLHAAPASRPSRRGRRARRLRRASAVTRRAGPTAPARRRRTRSCAATASGLGGADQRNPPHLLGLGPVALLAREMSAELRAQAAARRASARRRRDSRVEQPLDARRASRSVASPPQPDGTLDYGARRGRRSGPDGSSVRLEGPSGDAARHGRGVAPHPPGPALEPHPARGAATARSTPARTARARGTTSTRTASRSRSTRAC